MKPEISRGEVWEVVPDPIKGSEQAGFRPCLVVSHDSMNSQLQTVIVVPLTTKLKDWPTRVAINFEDRHGQAMCEQIRTVSKARFKSKLGNLRITEIVRVKSLLKQMLVD